MDLDQDIDSSNSSSSNRQDIDISSLSSANEITEDLTTNERSETASSDEDEDESAASLIDLGGGKDGGREVVKPRPYQLEMLEESLGRNIIVAVSLATFS